MRDARPEGSPYPKADLWLRGLARGVDFLLAFGLATLGHELGRHPGRGLPAARRRVPSRAVAGQAALRGAGHAHPRRGPGRLQGVGPAQRRVRAGGPLLRGPARVDPPAPRGAAHHRLRVLDGLDRPPGHPHRRHLRRHPGGGRQGGHRRGRDRAGPDARLARSPPGRRRAPRASGGGRPRARRPSSLAKATSPEPHAHRADPQPAAVRLGRRGRVRHPGDRQRAGRGHRAARPPARALRGLAARPRAPWRGSRPTARISSSTPPRVAAAASARPSTRRSSTSWASRTRARTRTRWPSPWTSSSPS